MIHSTACASLQGWAFVAALLLSGGCNLPQDPEGTLERVRSGSLRVGISENPPWTEWTAGSAAGIEPELLVRFADELHARIEWVPDTEGDLLAALERGELDVVVCGLQDDTPWRDRLGLTQPYLAIGGAKHVMAVAPGENRFLLELDRFLQEDTGDLRARFFGDGS